MPMFEQLPWYLKDKCEQAALGQVFTDYDAIAYSEIVKGLAEEDDMFDFDEKYGTVTWEPFEDYDADKVLDILEQLKRDFAWVAQAALEGDPTKGGNNDR